jgi:hypothetical protein
VTFSPKVRKLALLVHVVVSVGAIGAVGAFVALAAVGLASSDHRLVRAVYPAMEAIAWYAIVPSVVASLATGVAESIGTSWSLFRYYWVVAKLALTAVTVIALLFHMQPIAAMAALAMDPSAVLPAGLQVQLAAAAAAGLAVLLVMTVLSVYKPRGLTRHGWRVQQPA